MLSKQEIQLLLMDVESDERLWYPAASTFTNAPLALIQMALETQSYVYRKVLQLPLIDFSVERDNKKIKGGANNVSPKNI